MMPDPSTLPAELFSLVLRKLSIRELLRSQRVSKAWQSFILGDSALWRELEIDGRQFSNSSALAFAQQVLLLSAGRIQTVKLLDFDGRSLLVNQHRGWRHVLRRLLGPAQKITSLVWKTKAFRLQKVLACCLGLSHDATVSLQKLDITLGYAWSTQGEDMDFLPVLRRCKNLRELTLRQPCGFLINWTGQSAAQINQLKSLVLLRIEGSFDPLAGVPLSLSIINTTALYQLAPNLETIHLTGLRDYGWDISANRQYWPDFSIFEKLKSLALCFCQWQPLPEMPRSLERLGIHSVVDNSERLLWTFDHPPYLPNLKVIETNWNPTCDLPPNLWKQIVFTSGCSLRELEIDTISCFPFSGASMLSWISTFFYPDLLADSQLNSIKRLSLRIQEDDNKFDLSLVSGLAVRMPAVETLELDLEYGNAFSDPMFVVALYKKMRKLMQSYSKLRVLRLSPWTSGCDALAREGARRGITVIRWLEPMPSSGLDDWQFNSWDW